MFFEAKNSSSKASISSYWNIINVRSKLRIRTRNNPKELDPNYMLSVAPFWFPQVPGVYFRLFKQYVVFHCLAAEELTFCQPMPGNFVIHLLQLFRVQVGIDSLTVWNEIVKNNSLIIPPDAVHHFVFKMPMFGYSSGIKPLFNHCLCTLG